MLKRTSLLILDDNAVFAESLADVLALHGFETRWSASPAQAWEMALASAPDILIVDVNLGTTSGIDIARQFYSEGIVAAVIFLTGAVELNVGAITSGMHGVSRILYKPVEKETLLHTIGELVSKASGQSANRSTGNQ